MGVFDRVISGVKKAGSWALSEDNPVGRGNKRINEMTERKAKELDKSGNPYKAGALRGINDAREIVTPTRNAELIAVGAGVAGKVGRALKGIKVLNKAGKIKVGTTEMRERKLIEKGNKVKEGLKYRKTSPTQETLKYKDKLNTHANKASDNPEDFGWNRINKKR